MRSEQVSWWRHDQGEGLCPKFHSGIFQFLSHLRVQIQHQVLLSLIIDRPLGHAIPIRVPGSDSRHGWHFHLPGPWVGEANRFTYPVRAKFAQYFIIVLLSALSSSETSSAREKPISSCSWIHQEPGTPPTGQYLPLFQIPTSSHVTPPISYMQMPEATGMCPKNCDERLPCLAPAPPSGYRLFGDTETFLLPTLSPHTYTLQ